MKRKIFSLCVAMLLLLTMSIPVLAKSSSFSFELAHSIVDGSENNKYHTLDGGTYPKISGSMRQIGGSTVGAGTNTIYAKLYNKTSGNYFGTVELGKPDPDGWATSFSGTFNNKKTGGGSKYYLVIYRTNSDGRIMYGTGTLKD